MHFVLKPALPIALGEREITQFLCRARPWNEPAELTGNDWHCRRRVPWVEAALNNTKERNNSKTLMEKLKINQGQAST